MKKLILIVLAILSMGADPTNITGPSNLEPYKVAEFYPNADVAGSALIWDVYPEESVDIREYGQKLFFVAPPGVYKIKLRVITLDKDGMTKLVTLRHTLTIGKPPAPPPPPPDPADPATAKYRAAYEADTSAVKGTQTDKLSAIYRAGATSIAFDETLTTMDAVHAKLSTVTTAQIQMSIAGVRRVIGDELNASLPRGVGQKITYADRTKISSEFIRVANILDTLTP